MKVVPCTVVDLSGNVIANVLESKLCWYGFSKTFGKQGIGVYKNWDLSPNLL